MGRVFDAELFFQLRRTHTFLRRSFPCHYVDTRCGTPIVYISRHEKNDPAQFEELEKKAEDITQQTGVKIWLQSRS